MKVLIMNNKLERRGGADVVALNTGALLQKSGVDVVFFSRFTEGGLTSGNNAYVTDHSTNLFSYIYSKKSAAALESLLKREKPDLAHVHLFHGDLSYSILPVLKKFKIPIVITFHDYKLICPIQAALNRHNEVCTKCNGRSFIKCFILRCYKSNPALSLYKSIEGYVSKILFSPEKYYSSMIFVSKFSYNLHSRILPSDKYHLLYNFIPSNQYAQLPKEKNKFLFFGRVSIEKGLLQLITVWKEMNNSEIILKIVGTGPLLEEASALAKDADNIIFSGHISDFSELSKEILTSRFVIVPSQWYENNPMTILESFSLSTPVIGSNMGGIPELIDHGVNGYIFDHSNMETLKECIQNSLQLSEDSYNNMCKMSARKFNDNFNEKVHLEKLLNIYNEAVSPSK